MNKEIVEEKKTREQSGNWFYMCQGCHHPAMIFKGEELPNLSSSVEELSEDPGYVMGGSYRSKRPDVVICGFCKRPFEMNDLNRLSPERVFQVDSWCKARGKTIKSLGYASRDTQEVEGFLKKNNVGKVIQDKEEGRVVLRATIPQRPAVMGIPAP